MRTLGVGKKVTPKDTQNNKIIKKGCNPFLITALNIRPWRNWITQQIPILEIGGSNPFGRANFRLILDWSDFSFRQEKTT